jgi:acyl-CoA synthetase (NDP forming)
MDTLLRVNMPTVMSTKNPIDIIGDADSSRVLQILENLRVVTPTADVLLLFTIQATTDIDTIAEVLVEFRRREPGFTFFVALI